MIFCPLRVTIFGSCLILFGFQNAESQVAGYTGTQSLLFQRIETAVPFLLISPDARSGAMGDVGVATSPDINAIHWNPSKLAFTKDSSVISFSYNPWLSQLAPDIFMAQLSGFYKLDSRNTLGLSIKYFSVGDIEIRDDPAASLGAYEPVDLSVDGAFARSFGNALSLGTTLRFIYSKIGNEVMANGSRLNAATALAADFSAYYVKPIQVGKYNSDLAFGVNISNIGNKLGYVNEGSGSFLPTNMRLGTSLCIKPDSRNRFSVALDLNKLLVPTPPKVDENGKITSGRSTDRSVASGIFGSFSDAPGGFSEEIKEISMGLGLEYVMDQTLALRSGYYYEHPQKGERRYLTMGAGYLFKRFNLDFSYLVASIERSPLANSLRFSLMYKLN